MKLLPFRELLGRAGFTDFRLPSTPKDEEGHECEIYFGGAGRVLGAEGVACQHLESVDLPSGLSSIAVGNESALRLEDAALMDDRVFTCEMGTGDQPMVRVEYRGGTEEFRPEEVSLMLMLGTKETVEAHFGAEKSSAVGTARSATASLGIGPRRASSTSLARTCRVSSPALVACPCAEWSTGWDQEVPA